MFIRQHVQREHYKAPNYIDQDHGGLSKANRGNDGAKASDGDDSTTRRYAGGYTEDRPPADQNSEGVPGPITAVKPKSKMETGGGYRSPRPEDDEPTDPESGLLNQLKKVFTARGWHFAEPGLTELPAGDAEGIDYKAGQGRDSDGKFASGGGDQKPMDLAGWRDLPKKHKSLEGQKSLFNEIDVRTKKQKVTADAGRQKALFGSGGENVRLIGQQTGQFYAKQGTSVSLRQADPEWMD